jgi:hypothetical protein
VRERELRQVVDGVPARVAGDGRVDADGHEAEVGGRELGDAARLELLEVRHLAQVDLLGEVAADRRLQRLAGVEAPARQRPRAGERLPRALPEQHPEPRVAHLQHDREHGVGRVGTIRHWVSACKSKTRWRVP